MLKMTTGKHLPNGKSALNVYYGVYGLAIAG
jgi:hypothetical protein